MVTRLLRLPSSARTARRRRRARARAVPLVAGAARAAGCGAARRPRADRLGAAIAAAVGDAIAAALRAKERPMIGSVRGTVARAHRHGRGAGGGGRRRLPRARAGERAAGARTRATPTFLFTHLHVREDAMVLYGFPTRDERDTFEALIAHHRRRARSSRSAMLSVHSPAALRRALLEDDLAALTLVPGVGKRTAQRLLVELKAPPRGARARPHRRRAAAPRRGPRCAPRSPGWATRPTRCATCVAQLPEDGLGRGPAARRRLEASWRSTDVP